MKIKKRIHKTLLSVLLIIIIAKFSGCTMSRTVQLENYTPEPGFWVDHLVVHSKIKGVIFEKKNIFNFDSLGGEFNRGDSSLSGHDILGRETVLGGDSISYVILETYSQGDQSLIYDSYIDRLLILDNIPAEAHEEYFPYFEKVDNMERSAIIDTVNLTVQIKVDDLRYEKFPFSRIKSMKIMKRKNTMHAIRILSVIGAVTFVIVDNSDNF